MRSLHEELRDIRLERGVTLEQIYEKTKIRVHLLEKLESGDYSIVPIPYIRAFLKEYAMVIDLDPDMVIARYEKKIDSVRDVQPAATPPDTTSATAGSLPDSAAVPATETPDDTSLVESPVQPEHEQPATMDEPALQEAESVPAPGDDASLQSQGDEPGSDAGDSDNAADETGSQEADEIPATVPEQKPPAGKTGSYGRRKNALGKRKRIDDTAPVSAPIPETTSEPAPIEAAPEPDTNPSALIDDTAVEPPLVSASIHPPVPARAPGARLKIDDPTSSNTVFFVMVAILFIIAAIFVVVMNRSGF